MKKLLAFSVLVLVGTAVFAEIPGLSFNGWGRAAFAPVIAQSIRLPDDTIESKTYAGVGSTWGNLSRIQLYLHGNWETAGLELDFGLNQADALLHFEPIDNAHIWVKPFSGSDIFTVRIGKFSVDNLHGKIANLNGGFEHFTLTQEGEDGAIFQSFSTGELAPGSDRGKYWGALISSSPIPGLFMAAKIEAPNIFGDNDADWNTYWWTFFEAKDVYKKIQVGAGYQIGDIGLIRVQYVGASGHAKLAINGTNTDWSASKVEDGRIEAAFAFTKVPGLTVDLGTKIYLGIPETDTYYDKDGKEQEISGMKLKATRGAQVNLGVQFNKDALGIGATVQTSFGKSFETNGKTQYEGPFKLNFHLSPTYNIDGLFQVGLDFGLIIQSKEKDRHLKEVDETDFVQAGFGAYIAKFFGNGLIKAGLACQLPRTYGGDKKDYGYDYTDYGVYSLTNAFVFSIPVILEYWF